MVFCPQCGTKMADEANFCLNCGENLAKYRTGSGFVKESVPEGERPSAGATAPTPSPPQRSPRGKAPRQGSEVEIEIGSSGQSLSPANAESRALKALLSDARMAADTGNLQAAADTFHRAVELDPESADAWYGSGVVYGRLGRQLEALAAFNQLVEISPRLAGAWDARGTALASLGRSGE